MNGKQQILTTLSEEFSRWEELLASLSEAQITAPQLPAHLSLKDVIAHLLAWQQRSIARLEAAGLNRKPEFPQWPEGLDPETDDDPVQINAWIYETYREQPWSNVHQAWSEGFLRFLQLGEAIPENDLLDAGRYPWMEGQPLATVLLGSYEHHHVDHLEPVLTWLRQQGNMKIAG